VLLDAVTRTDRQFVNLCGRLGKKRPMILDEAPAPSLTSPYFRPWQADRACDRIRPIESQTEAWVCVSAWVLDSRHNQSTRLTPCPLWNWKKIPPPGWLTTLSCDPSSWWEEVLGNWGTEDLADVIYAYGHRCLGGCNINYQSASCKLLGLQPAARNVHIISNLLRIYVPCDMKGNPGTLAKKACTFLGSNCGYTGSKGVWKTYRQDNPEDI